MLNIKSGSWVVERFLENTISLACFEGSGLLAYESGTVFESGSVLLVFESGTVLHAFESGTLLIVFESGTVLIVFESAHY